MGAPSPAERWLVVGHGSVGSFLTARLVAGGASVLVYDPEPRVPVAHGNIVLQYPKLPGQDTLALVVQPGRGTHLSHFSTCMHRASWRRQ